MALKKPSDFFGESKKESIIENLVKKPELGSFSAAVNSYKENISKFEDLSETLKSIESIQSDIKDFIKKEDLDNAVGSYAFLLEETVAKLKNDVKGINEKNLISMRSNISNLTEKINTFFKIEVPKYKKNIVEIEIKSSDKFEKYKNDTDVILEDISKYVSDKYESIDGINKDTILEIEKSISKHQIDIEQRTEKNISSVNETVDRVVEDLEKKINLISDNKDTIFQDLSKKITEVKNLKKSVNKDLKVYEDHKNNVENKISDLEIEVIRSKSNLKNQNEEFIKVKKDIGNDFNTIHEEFKTVVNRLNLDELEEKNIQLSKKVKYLEEIFDKFNEKEFLNEGIVNITPETDNSDPLTPLDKNYVTLNQLQDHYRLFLNRIQQQLSTLGGGGETRLQYLDDIVGVATNLSAYNGKFLKIDTSQPAGKNFVFETVSGGGGGGSSDVVDDTTPQLGGNLDLNGKYITGTGGVNITGDAKISGVTTMGNVVVGGATTDLVVTGDARVTGILTIGTASITLDGENGEVLIPTTMKVGSAITCSSSGDSFWAGIVTATNFKTGTTNVHSNGIEVAGINALGADTPIGTGATIYDEGGAGFTGVVTSTKSHVGLDTGFFNEDLVVTGDARVTGILTIGTGSITLDPNAKTITGVDELEIGTGDDRIKLKKSSRGTIDFVDKDNRSIGGIGSEAKINTTGVVTATTFSGALTGTATNATRLDNRISAYYLNYDNFSNTPTIPTNNNQLTNGAGFITTSFTNTNQLTNGAGFITTSFTNTNQLTNGAGFITAAGTLTNGTQTNITSIGTLTSLEVNGNVSIGGVLTYEDVKNVDSVGIVTARRGIVVGSGYGIHVASGVITATTFDGNLATSAQTNITSVGTIGAGTWQGTAIGDSYISSAATWNAKQSALTFGIANTNAIKIDDADAADNDYAKLTATGIEGRSYAEVKTDLTLGNVENTALSTWAGSTNITTLGTIATGTWNGTKIAAGYLADTAVSAGSYTSADITIDAQGRITAASNGSGGGGSSNATNFNCTANNSNNETVYPVFVDGTTGNQGAETDSGFTYNPSTGTLTATTFIGDLTGTATYANWIDVDANNSNNETCYPLFADAATGWQKPESDTGFTYNPSTGTLTATTFIGDLTGTATYATYANWVDVDDNNSNDETCYPLFVDGATSWQKPESDTGFTYNPSTGTLTATTFTGSFTGSLNGIASYANLVDVDANNSNDETCYPLFVDGDTGWQKPESDTGFMYNPSSGNLTATTFTGALTGNVNGTATYANLVDVDANNSNDETCYPLFVDGDTGMQKPESDTGFTYNPSTGNLTATTFTGSFSGTATYANLVDVDANNSNNETCYLAFFDGATGMQKPETDTGLMYNPSSGNLTATTFSGDGSNLTGISASDSTKLPLAGGTLTGNLTISNTHPQIFFTDTDNNSDYKIQNLNGVFGVRDETNSETRLTIKSNGNVGINTTDPGARLEIWADDDETNKTLFSLRGKTSAFNIRVDDADAANPTWTLRSYASEPIAFAQGTTEIARFNGSGNLGIGSEIPAEKLDVNGTIQCLNELKSKTGNDLLLNAGSANRDVKIQVNDVNMLYVKGDTGKIGIGTDTPVAKLDVYVDNTQTGGIIQVTQDGTGDAAIDFQLKGTREYTLGIDNSDSDKFKLSGSAGLDNNTLLTVTNAGKIGIGTDGPNVALEVLNDSPGLRLTDKDSSAGLLSYTQLTNINGNTYVYSRANSANGSYLIGGAGGGTFDEHVRITPAGDVGIGTGNPIGANAVTGNGALLAVGIVTTNSVYGKLNNLTFPTANGTDGYVLTSNGSGIVQWEAAPGAGGGISGITVQEEGSDLATLATTLNFVGDSVTASGTGATKTITISGGGGGSTDMLEVMLFA